MEYMYGALLLHKLGKEVNEDNLKKVVEATGETVDDAKIKTVVASLKGVDIDKELESASLVASAPAAASAGSASAGGGSGALPSFRLSRRCHRT